MATTSNSEIKEEEERKGKKAYGLIDTIINHMPEIHVPGYRFAGPGTKLEERLSRGERGINKLDDACMDHDIAYANCEDSKSRRKADKILINRAIKRIFSRSATLDERAVALLVSGLMSAKVGLSKIGLGLGGKRTHKKKRRPIKRHSKRHTKRRTKRSKVQKSITFSKLTRGVKTTIKNKKLDGDDAIKAAIRSAKEMKRGKTVKKIPRILKLPKFGGNLNSILPILSGLSAIGSITSSAVGVAKALKDIEVAKKQLKERTISNGRNMCGEKKIGRRLNLIYKNDKSITGSGFYLKPHQR